MFFRGPNCYYTQRMSLLASGASLSEVALPVSALVPPLAQTMQLNAVLRLPSAGTAVDDVSASIGIFAGSTFSQLHAGKTGSGGSSFSAGMDSQCMQVPNVSNQLFYSLSAPSGSPTLDIYINGFSLPTCGQ